MAVASTSLPLKFCAQDCTYNNGKVQRSNNYSITFFASGGARREGDAPLGGSSRPDFCLTNARGGRSGSKGLNHKAASGGL